MKAQWFSVAACAIGLSLFAPSIVRAQQDERRYDQDRDRDRIAHFTDTDRQILHDWYREHADWMDQYRNEGWRDEELDRRLQVGAQLGPDMRRWSHPVPEELVSRMDTLPRYWRVVAMGDHILLVDDEWNVRDVIHLDQFNDHDREVIRDWNRDHPDFVRGILGNFGLRIDTGDLDRRLQVGMIVDTDLRDHARPVPEELSSRLSPQPRDWQYVVIGDRLCLVDRNWRVRESFHFER